MFDDRGLKDVYHQKDRAPGFDSDTWTDYFVVERFVQTHCGSQTIETEIDIFLIYDLAQYALYYNTTKAKKKITA